MKKILLISALIFLSFVLLPLSTSATTDTEQDDKQKIEILVDGYEVLENEESGDFAVFKVKTVENENGDIITLKEPVDYILKDNQIITNEITIAKINPSEAAPIQTYGICGYYQETKTISRTKIKSNSFLAYHPKFKKWDKVDGYYFGTSSVSYSISIGGGYGSVGVSVAPPGSGTFIFANSSKWSRPGIYGNLYKRRYLWQKKSCTGRVLDSEYRNYYYTTGTYNKTVYK